MASSGSGVPPPDPPFHGREGELGLLREFLDRSTAGPLHALLIEGEAGVGKSRLLRQLQADAHARGFRVLAGAAQELERGRAFGVFFELARSHSEEGPEGAVFENLLKLGVTGGTQAGEGGFAVTEEVLACLATCAARAPVLLCLEDLHWADISTISTTSALVTRLGDLPLAVLVTLRPAPRPREVDHLIERLRAAGAGMLRLPPLPEDAVLRIAGAVLGAAPGLQLRERIAAAAGNPLFVVELLRALQQEGLISKVDDTAEVRQPLVPVNLRQTLLRRYSFLTADTLALLRMASILGPSFSMTELAAVCERRPPQLMAQLQEAVSSGLVEESGENLAFRHDLFRQVLYEDMPVALRIALHREAGRALVAVGATVTRVAEQLLLGDPQGTQTVDWLCRAARETATRSTPLAVRWYERALQAVGSDHQHAAAITAELVPQLVLLGRVTQAQEAAARALRHTDDPSLSVRLRVVVGHALTRQGLWTAAKEQLERAASRLRDPSAVAVASAPLTFLRLITGEAVAAVAQAERSQAAAEEVHNRLAVATCLMTRTLGASAAGDTENAIALGLRCLDVTAGLRSSFRGLLLPELCLGVAYLDADRTAEAERSFRDGFAQATRVGATGLLPYLQANLAILRLHTGAWDDAGSEAEACLELARSTGTRWTLHALAVRIRVSISGREFRAAACLLANAEAELRDYGQVMGANWVLWAKALLLEAEGREAEAGATAAEAWEVLPELRFLHTNWMLPVDLLRLTLRAGDTRAAAAILEETESVAARIHTASATGAALRCRALLHADLDAALGAVAAYATANRPAERALAQAQGALALAGAGRLTEARDQSRAALDAFAALGLKHEEDQVGAALRSFRIHRGRPRSAKPATGWDSLTATELTVVGLVAQGLSNPEIANRMFISRYTVETHLKHVFHKLGISSRVALANEVTRQAARQTNR
jgi:DNA-binding CsgD family transcriptional regulator